MVFVGRKHLFLVVIVEGHLFYTCSPFRSILVQSYPKMLLQNRDNKNSFQLRQRISIRGRVRPSVRLSRVIFERRKTSFR